MRVVLVLVTVFIVGCGPVTGQVAPSASVSTLNPGWERKFEVRWQATPEADGRQRIDGYVLNNQGRAAYPVHVLVQSVDASGAVADRRIALLPETVGGFGRAYFDVPHVASADHYVVSVWDYSLNREQ